MENPNNCETCKHKQHPDGGWCYMFRDEPRDVCMVHSLRNAQVLPPGWTLTADGKLRPPPDFAASAYEVPNAKVSEGENGK